MTEEQSLWEDTFIQSGSGSAQKVFTETLQGIECGICKVKVTGVNNAIAHRKGKQHQRTLLRFPRAYNQPNYQKTTNIPVVVQSAAPVTKALPKHPPPKKKIKTDLVEIPRLPQEQKPLTKPAAVEKPPYSPGKVEIFAEDIKSSSSSSSPETSPTPIATIPLRLPLTTRNSSASPKMAEELQLFLNLDDQEASFVGVEYLVEMQQYDTEPRYHCVLCDKYGDPRTIIIHISSTAHRIKFFDQHYPSMMKELGELRYDKDSRVAVMKVLEEVSMAVEKHHGRLQPLIVLDHQYKGDRSRYLQQILSGRHFSENSGPSFINLVDKKKMANITRTVKLKADVKRTVAEVEAAKRSTYDAMERSESPRRRSSYRSRSRSRSRSPRRRPYNADRRRSPSPRRRRSRTPERRPRVDPEKREKYSAMKTAAVKEVETRYQEYELHPEKHPLYSVEWETFWNRRYKELQAEHKDPNGYDFKPEWIAFWIRRLKDLFNADVESAKRDIKIKLGLQLHESPTRSPSVDSRSRRDERKRRPSNDDWSDDEREKRNRRERSRSTSRSRPSGARRSSRSPSRSTVQSKRRYSRSPSLDRRERIRELDRIISRLPPAAGSSRSGGPDYSYGSYGSGGGDYDYHYSSRERYGRERERKTSANLDRDDSSNSTGGPIVIPDDDDEPLSVVAVLRILAALEDQLGSLGTKTLDMLAKALAMEKAKANSSDELMMTENNAVFFETIKEKLKGQLITGVLSKSKVGAVKKAIRKIAEVLHEIAKKAQVASKTEKEASKRTIVIKVAMGKEMIAQRIALALVTEKKTDVTPEQLEVLINVFFEMLRKSKELNKMVTTQDYIELLEEEKVQSVADKVDILGIIGEKDKGEKDPLDGSRRKSDKPVVKLDFTAEIDATRAEEDLDEDAKGSQGESFTDSDLKTLLQNFRDLSSDEQQHLIKHLKKLETTDPDRVEKLRKFVPPETVRGKESGARGGGGGGGKKSMSEELSMSSSRWEKLGITAKAVEPPVAGSSTIPGLTLAPVPPPVVVVEEAAAVEKEANKVKFDMKKKDAMPSMSTVLGEDDDEDDDDYNLTDVVKAAAQNLDGGKSKSGDGKTVAAVAGPSKDKSKEKDKPSGSGARGEKKRSVSPESKKISETHDLIANIMGSLKKKVTGTDKPVAPKPGPSGGGGGGGAGQRGKNQNSGSLPFYQQQKNGNYNSTYQEQIAQQQQQQQYMQYQQQMQQQGMMYQQQQMPGNGGQWWSDQNQMYQQQQGFYGNQQQYPQQYPNNNNGQNYGNYY